MARSPAYSRSVFVNCPFDDAYRPLMRAILFSVEACWFAARTVLESSNAGEPRIEKITRIVRESRFGIHDISRTESNADGLPRFNMPFELGLFLGMRAVGDRAQRSKSAAVFDRDPYRFRHFLSDLAGSDILGHDNDSLRVVGQVRDWLSIHSERPLPGKAAIVGYFVEFNGKIPALTSELGLTLYDLHNMPDYLHTVRYWIEEHFPAARRS